MANMAGHQFDNSNEVNRKKQIWLRVMMVLAAIVVFFTTYALILPAITMEGALVCEKEEHTHTDACYETVFVEISRDLDCDKNHEHTDDCYDITGFEEQKLICGKAEHTHTADCYEAPLFARLLAAPLGANNAATETKIYWKPITSTSELSTDDVYMIVTKSGDVALYGSSATTSAKANMQEAAEKPGYYTSELDDNYWWKVTENGSSSKLFNVHSNNYLVLTSTSIITNRSSSGTTNSFAYHNDNQSWSINSPTTSWGRTTNHYLDYGNGKFTYYSNDYLSMVIYKQYIEEVPVSPEPTTTPTATPTPTTDPGGGTESLVKPSYAPYVPESGPLTGETSHEGVEGNYWSDPATSQLESKFNGVSADDGKVLTDKSVIYGKDDYNAFSSYDPNTFGVTLSALAQTYAISEKVQAPIDVVFVVDTSGSMLENYTVNGRTTNSATENAKALNRAMHMVMDANPDNRMGVVCFSNDSHKILELGRYTATNNKYFPESGYDNVKCTFAPDSSVRYENGGTPFKGSANQWYGTYTQSGIAEGAQELIDATDKQVDVTVEIDAGDGRTIQKTVTMTRRPVIILLSDGEPTFCNENYDSVLEHENTIHGNGSDGYIQDGDAKFRPENNWGNRRSSARDYISESSFDGSYPPDYSLRSTDYIRVNNPKGVMGYYTILSANSYKDQIAKAYGTDTYFYTIGLGMNPGSKDSITRSISSDIYKTAVLNPTPANIAALSTTSGRTTTSEANTAVTDISQYTLETSTMLQQLLNNTATPGNNKWIKSSGGKNYVYVEQLIDPNGISIMGSPQATSGTVPVINNPYAGNYQYNNGATFSNNPTADDLAAIYESAINAAGNAYVYGFLLKNGNALTVSDTIGQGMEIVRDSSGNTIAPVLNYGGINYPSTSHETVDGKVVYHYSGIYRATDGSGRTVDVSKITAVVETVDGQQKVSMVIPEDAVPLYSPCVDANHKTAFYYEDLPARLIYQVGLTDESKEAVAALKNKGGELTFYTNEWQSDTNYANAVFEPTDKNPYYKDNDYNKDPRVKSENTTTTKENAWKYDPSCDNDYVKEELGNNGKLHFEAEVPTTDIVIHKVDMVDQVITTGEASFELYSDEALTELVGEYTTNKGEVTIPGLTVGETYYLVETKAPDGYSKLEEPIAFTVMSLNRVDVGMNSMADCENGVMLVRNNGGYMLPETGGIGTLPIYALGALFLIGALVYGNFLRRKREGRAG